MIQDINFLDNQAQLHCDICIVGAGAAGITLALELEGSGKSVILLEGGDLESAGPGGLELYSGESTGIDYKIQSSRLRFFGGTTNHWGGWCRPLDKIDFEIKSHIQHSGWPLSRQDLSDYYKRAAEICELDGFQDFERLNESEAGSVIDVGNSTVLTNRYFLFSPPTRFGKKYRRRIESSRNIKCYLNANATELIMASGEAIGVRVNSLLNKKFNINSNKVILAMGGLENPRFLLSNCQETKEAYIPNKNALIGKYFMDHPGVSPGHLLLQSELKYYRHKGKSSAIMPVLSLSSHAIKKFELNNMSLVLYPQKPDKTLNSDYFENSFIPFHHKGAHYRMQVVTEPSPYRNSQVSLSSKIDGLGMRKLKLNWEINPEDFVKIEKALELISKELGVLGIGRYKVLDGYIEKAKNNMGYGMHHMGTTRMGNDKNTSVVNSYGEMHEIRNLFVAGSSIFPTVGFSNPTLTITALAVRLADHLKLRA